MLPQVKATPSYVGNGLQQYIKLTVTCAYCLKTHHHGGGTRLQAQGLPVTRAAHCRRGEYIIIA